MAWSTPRTWAVNEVLTAANMNTYVSDDLAWMGTSRPHCRVLDSSFSHTSSGNWLSPTWDSATTNVGSMYPGAAGYVTAATAGFYIVGAQCEFAANATGARAIMISSAANGSGTVYGQNFVPSQSIAVAASTSTALACTASLNLYCSVFQTSGGTLTVSNVRMWAFWVTT